MFLSLLIPLNGMATSAPADYSRHIVPALKIAGGTFAAATTIISGALGTLALTSELKEPYPKAPGAGYFATAAAIPIFMSATILSAMAFGYTKDVNVSRALKIMCGSFMGLYALAYGSVVINQLDSKSGFAEKLALSLLPVICPITLSALSFHSLLK